MIELIDYKDEWENSFKKFKDTVVVIAKGLVKEVEHIGSTSIRPSAPEFASQRKFRSARPMYAKK